MAEPVKTVILVGCGATLAEALPRRPPLKERPPLDRTFFDLCRRADFGAQKPIKSYMVASYGRDPFAEQMGMEEVFNMIFANTFTFGEPTDECLDAYWALLEMYRQAIGETTNELRGDSRCGVGGLLRALWQNNSQREFTFVTFNQDLVIEKALEAAKTTRTYSAIPWDIEHCYALRFVEFVTRSRNSQPFSSGDGKSTRVLKLHGSLNWTYVVRSPRDRRGALRAPKAKLRCVNEQQIVYGPLTLANSYQYDRAVHMVPLVVPPIYEKGRDHLTVVHPLWALARDAIRDADDLFVFGYSFPPADVVATCLVQSAFHRNSKLAEVHIIDPDPDIGGRVRTLLGAPSVHVHADVKALVATLQ